MAATASSTPSTALVIYDDAADTTVRLAIAGFLAGYTYPTRASYTTDLRIFTAWCCEHRLGLLDVTRAHLELFARAMETDGKMRSTVARRLSTLCSFYRYCQVEGITTKNPAANVRRPKVDYESRTLGLDRNELGGLLVQAGLGSSRDHALISLLAMNGLRISESARCRHRRPRHRTRRPHPEDLAHGKKARHDSARSAHRSVVGSLHR